jgi:hypothetical protein
MKKLVAVSLFLILGGFAIAQEKPAVQVPLPIMEAFRCLYPSISHVSWSFDDINYTASFKSDGKAMALLFDEYGYLVGIKNEIRLYELPLDVNHFLSREYSDWRIDTVSHIDSNGTAYYETVVEKEEQTMVLVFNRQGGLLMKVFL